MMRSMYSAVSGLRIHQGKMDTIGNNVANVNTIGFKKGQVSFQEVFSQVTRGASAPQAGKGGTNPQQIGMGASVGSISTVQTMGNGQRTDNPTDLMIGGEGFFTVSDDSNFNNKFYTRAGNFSLDRDGNLVTAEGLRVLGYSADKDGNIQSDVTNIRINKSETKAPSTTKGINFRGNLDSSTKVDGKHLTDTTIQDSLGNSYKVTFEITKSSDANQWNYVVKRVTDSLGNYSVAVDDDNKETDGKAPGVDEGEGTLLFNDDGKLLQINETILDPKPSPKVNFGFKINDDITFNLDKDGKPVTVQKTSGVFDNITIFDTDKPETFKDLSQYANQTDIKPYKEDGNTSGVLEEFTIDATGTVVGIFTNGERKALGQIMLAKFDNAMGLQKMGGNLFLDTRNSGEAQFGKAGTSGYGAIEGGVLEMSNVDIALEFTEMITTQRGFQANSRIITTSDEMLQELVNMKR